LRENTPSDKVLPRNKTNCIYLLFLEENGIANEDITGIIEAL
jgi:hypothetical protein